MREKTERLSDVLGALADATKGSGKISVGDVVRALRHRGFGPLLMAPAIIVILPTGAIPGVPALCAAFICIVSIQIFAGRNHPWIPGPLERFSFRRQKFTEAVKRAQPFTDKIDKFAHPRLKFFAIESVQRLMAIYCFVLGVFMFFIGFIPFVPALLALPILFYALGVSARDGLMILLGLLLGIGVTGAGLYFGLRGNLGDTSVI